LGLATEGASGGLEGWCLAYADA